MHPNANDGKEGSALIGVIIAVLFAALVYALCLALGLPAIVGLIAAILVLLAGIPTGGYGIGRR
jgi:high-affinity Fe2+/Pb2+ permease